MLRVPLIAAFIAVSSLPGPISAQDVTGTWEISWETPRGGQTVMFAFTQEGATLAGSAEMSMGRPGGGQGRTRTVEVSNGTVQDGAISFDIVMGRGQRSFTLRFAGTVAGDAMEGTVTNPRGGEDRFEGKRK